MAGGTHGRRVIIGLPHYAPQGQRHQARCPFGRVCLDLSESEEEGGEKERER